VPDEELALSLHDVAEWLPRSNQGLVTELHYEVLGFAHDQQAVVDQVLKQGF